MQLVPPRLRFFLIGLVWLIAIVAIAVWLGGARLERVTIAGGPSGSETLVLTQAIADAINESNIGIKVLVFETGGSFENLRLLENRRIDMGTLQGDTPASDDVLGVVTLYSDAYHLIASNEAQIDSFADLPGHRIAIPPETSGQYNSFWFLAQHYGLDQSRINAQPMDEEAANFAMEQGQVEALFRVRAPGNQAIRELIGDKALRLVPIEQSEALALIQPAIAPGIIPLGSYRGHPALPRADLDTALVQRLLVVRSDMDPSLVYKLTQAIYSLRSEIMESTMLAGFIGPLPDDADSVISAHPGARNYYEREKPGFFQQNARLVSAILYVIAIVFSALLALRTHWVRSRRMRMHDYNKQLMDIAGGARGESVMGDLLQRKHQLVDILQEVVGDLDKEKVSQDEFEHFSFTWQAVDALVRDRINLVDTLNQRLPEA